MTQEEKDREKHYNDAMIHERLKKLEISSNGNQRISDLAIRHQQAFELHLMGSVSF